MAKKVIAVKGNPFAKKSKDGKEEDMEVKGAKKGKKGFTLFKKGGKK